jgi:tetratricopeptide (TPR) repeat protein
MTDPGTATTRLNPESTAVSTTDLAAVRNLVYQGSSAAAAQAAELQERLVQLTARAELLAALAAAIADAKSARSRVLSAVRSVRELQLEDAETFLDVVFGLLVARRADEAARVALGSIDDASTATIKSVAVISVIDRLVDAGRESEADKLLASALRRVLISCAPEPPASEPTAAPESRSPRRQSRLAITDKVLDVYDRVRDAGREVKADDQLRSVLRQLAVGDSPLTALEGTSEAMVSRTSRRLLDELMPRSQKRLESGTEEPSLRTLHAAALVVTDRSEEALQLVDDVPAGESGDERPRWVRIAALTRLDKYDEALHEVEQLPEAPYTTTLRVRVLLRADRGEEAIQVATGAREAAPEDVDVALATAEALTVGGRGDEALTVLDGLRQQSRTDVLMSRAHILHDLGRRGEAIEVLDDIVERDPTDVSARAARGRLYGEDGDLDAALDELDAALSLVPDRPDLLLLRAQLLDDAGRFVEALQNVDDAVVAGAEGPDVAALRGDILRRLERFDEALEAYLTAFRSRPKEDADKARRDATVVERLAGELLEERGYLEHALDALDELRSRKHLSSDGMALRAELLRVNGRPKEAVEQARAAAAAGATSALLAGTTADCLYTLGLSAEALEEIEPVVREQPDYLFGQIVRIQALASVDRPTEALNVLAVFEDEPYWKVWATTAHGSLLLQLGRFEEAVAVLEGALGESPEESWWLVQLGVAYSRLDRAPEAIEAFQRGIDNLADEPAPWVRLELADALTSIHDSAPDEALAVYRTIAEGGFDAALPRSGLGVGWASLRLRLAEESLGAYQAAFEATTDPFLVSHLCVAVALELAGRSRDAAAEIDRTLEAVAALEDRGSAMGTLAEGHHILALLGADPAWESEAERLADFESRMGALAG